MNSENVKCIADNLRKCTVSVPNRTNRSCLIVQGGGMRGSYSMGALLALQEMGYSESFDYIIGSSAGAINAAYFLAKQSKLATGIYIDYLTTKKFINLLRPLKILDANYLIDVFTKGKTVLDSKAVMDSKTDLQFSLVGYPSAEEVFLSVKEHPFELMNLIKASASIPAISNEKITIAGKQYIDGAVVDPIPIHHAIKIGCTDIVLILTRSRSFRRKSRRFVYDNLSWSYFKDWPKQSKDSIFERFSGVNDIYDYIWKNEGDNGRFRLLIIAPSKDNLAGLLSKSKKKISENVQRGYRDAKKVFCVHT